MANITEINDLNAEEIWMYCCRSEIQLLRYYEPQPGIFIAESAKVIRRALDAGYEPMSLLIEKKMIDGSARDIVERCGNVPIYTADLDVLIHITGFHMTQGLFCAMRRRKPEDVKLICGNARRVAVLEAVENQTNVGAIFRSAAALNFDAVLLTAGCSDPLYRRAIRVSMGTVFQIPWTFFRCGVPDYMGILRNMGFATAAMALRDDTVAIDDPRLLAEEKLAVILGNESVGLTHGTISTCDYTVKIPMSNGVDSLNVAAASAVAFWELGKIGRNDPQRG